MSVIPLPKKSSLLTLDPKLKVATGNKSLLTSFTALANKRTKDKHQQQTPDNEEDKDTE